VSRYVTFEEEVSFRIYKGCHMDIYSESHEEMVASPPHCSRSNGHQVSKRRALAYPVGFGRVEQLWSKRVNRNKTKLQSNYQLKANNTAKINKNIKHKTQGSSMVSGWCINETRAR
jgi:hypothetical protein